MEVKLGDTARELPGNGLFKVSKAFLSNLTGLLLVFLDRSGVY